MLIHQANSVLCHLLILFPPHRSPPENHKPCFGQAEFLLTSSVLSQNYTRLAKWFLAVIKILLHLYTRNTEKKVTI